MYVSLLSLSLVLSLIMLILSLQCVLLIFILPFRHPGYIYDVQRAS